MIYELIKTNRNLVLFSGHESYENQVKFGKKTFLELEAIATNGYHFNGIWHKIDVVCCCDWKAGACIEGC